MAQNTAKAEALGLETLKRAERPIDLVHLAKQCLGDEALEYEVLRLFDTTAATYFGRLQLALTADDLLMNLHSLKGASGGVGAWSIADLAKAAEDEIKAGRPLAPERIADMAIAVEEVRAFIAEMLKNEPAEI